MKRIQRQRTKGWRMPEGAVYVGRPSPWGNPFPVDGPWIEWACVSYGYGTAIGWRQAMAVVLYRWWMGGTPPIPAVGYPVDVDYEPIELTYGSAGGTAWLLNGHGTIDLPLRPPLNMLRGHDLVCWCPLDDPLRPCHADVLLELAA